MLTVLWASLFCYATDAQRVLMIALFPVWMGCLLADAASAALVPLAFMILA